MRVNVGELAEKYVLDERVVIEEIEVAISDFLRAELGYDIECIYDEKLGEFKIYGFDETRGSRYEVSPAKLDSVSFRKMLEVIQSRLIQRSLEDDFDYYYKLAGTLIVGRVVKILDSGDIVVEYSEGGKSVYCIYPVSQQPNAEIGSYVLGERYIFYVLRVMIDFEGARPRLKIILSRKSKSLVELLLKQELMRRGYYDIDVRVVKRIANAFSGVIVNKKIPREVIKKVAGYLQERVIVKFFKEKDLPPEEVLQSNGFWKHGKNLRAV